MWVASAAILPESRAVSARQAVMSATISSALAAVEQPSPMINGGWPGIVVICRLSNKRQVRLDRCSSDLVPDWVDRTEICFSSVVGTLRISVLGGRKRVVNQWLAANGPQIGMLLKMI